jgi:hypothetical protein
VPAQFQALVQPYIPAIVEGIHVAFSQAIVSTLWLSAAAAFVAAVATLALREVPLRTSVRGGAPEAPGAARTSSGVTATD